MSGHKNNGPDACNGEAENEGPYHAQYEFEIPIDNVYTVKNTA